MTASVPLREGLHRASAKDACILPHRHALPIPIDHYDLQETAWIVYSCKEFAFER